MWQHTNCIMSVYDICIEILNGGIMGANFLIFCMVVWSGKIPILKMDAGGAFRASLW